MVAHHAECVKMKLILLLGPPDGVNKDFATKFAAQVEAAVIAPDRDMVRLFFMWIEGYRRF